jgi:hypothetical protein
MRSVTLVFQCPDGHEIERPHYLFDVEQSKDAIRKLDATVFPLSCKLCTWEGTRLGIQRSDIR